jgi:C4-dicarboxylate-specific signal transduction histidine kinase
VTDSGSGMAAETAAHAFEPFYTTRFTGRGLGLAAVDGIVRANGGAIRLATQPGSGTTVDVLLPAARAG